VSSGRRRIQLYGQIVRQIRDREPRHVSLRPEPGPVVADCALEKIGWLLQHGVVSGQEATQKLGEYLAAELDLPAVAAEVKAEEYLAFWEDRGILERLTAGTREALVFVHVQLGEYAAVRHASRLDREELVRWDREVRRDPHGREVVLLAAGVGILCGIAGALLGIYYSMGPSFRRLRIFALSRTHALALILQPEGRVTAVLALLLGDVSLSQVDLIQLASLSANQHFSSSGFRS
jgi:hypothetical protein